MKTLSRRQISVVVAFLLALVPLCAGEARAGLLGSAGTASIRHFTGFPDPLETVFDTTVLPIPLFPVTLFQQTNGGAPVDAAVGITSAFGEITHAFNVFGAHAVGWPGTIGITQFDPLGETALSSRLQIDFDVDFFVDAAGLPPLNVFLAYTRFGNAGGAGDSVRFDLSATWSSLLTVGVADVTLSDVTTFLGAGAGPTPFFSPFSTGAVFAPGGLDPFDIFNLSGSIILEASNLTQGVDLFVRDVNFRSLVGVPEPSAVVLWGIGVVGLVLVGARNRKRAARTPRGNKHPEAS